MTVFQDEVRQIVREIPAGKVLSYREVAIAAGRPRAYRAVATVMANNYDPTVPCHRVVRSNGQLGDYNRGGTKRKRALLQKEGAIL